MRWGTHFWKLGNITNPLIRDAMDLVKREDFLPIEKRYLADEDHPIDIGYGQTNSQPYTVAFMLELLDPSPGQKILDIGSGSGWTSAILAYIVSQKIKNARKIVLSPPFEGGVRGGISINTPPHSSPAKGEDTQGKVYAVERIPELVKFGEENASKYSFIRSYILTFLHSDGSFGLSAHAPYDRILASAAFDSFPDELVDQLATGGVMVIPVGGQTNDIVRVRKDEKGNVTKKVFPGFVFVPMIGDNKNKEKRKI